MTRTGIVAGVGSARPANAVLLRSYSRAAPRVTAGSDKRGSSRVVVGEVGVAAQRLFVVLHQRAHLLVGELAAR